LVTKEGACMKIPMTLKGKSPNPESGKFFISGSPQLNAAPVFAGMPAPGQIRKSNRLRILTGIALALSILPAVYALGSYLTTFNTTYPVASTTQLNSCGLCHLNPAGGGTRNAFGNDFANNGHRYAAIQNLDSDGDGYTNIQEINAGTFPGDAASHPGSVTDATPPTITGFSMPATSSSLMVPITALMVSDNVGVTGFLLTLSSTKPAATASGWTATLPSSYTFGSAGTQTLYLWAKDAAGNISSSASAAVVITLPSGPDTTPPTVTSFSLPATAGSLTIAITTFTATDNIAVTGYLVTTTSTTPSGSAVWTSSAPTSYALSSAGTKTLYAWARDAAGNISSGRQASTTISLPATSTLKSINSTSQNRSSAPQALVSEQPLTQSGQYTVLAANDLGMHCQDLDQRVASILPPFNVVHAQVIRKGHQPVLLDSTQAVVAYSASSNPVDPALSNPAPASIYKANFWDINPRTGKSLAFDAFDAYYPPGILKLFQLAVDIGLPVPNLQLLYPLSGAGQLVADQQGMPSAYAKWVTQAYSLNIPQSFALFYKFLPFFKNFAFGYNLPGINWFSAEGIPLTSFDDLGRQNSYPLMRIQAYAVQGNSQGLRAGTVMSSLDVVTPVSGEVSCGNCHLSAPYGNAMATSGIAAITPLDDPQYGKVPQAVSLEYAFDKNILRLHDLRNGTNLQNSTPVSCQRCHYTPALDLAHLGPSDLNGRQQTTHETFSRAMHTFHGSLGVFPQMPSPVGRTTATRDAVLSQSCYQCHPGQITKCFRGEMYNSGAACQDCHGNLTQLGNDFSKSILTARRFTVRGDFYTNASTPRVPWANEPMCQSCHTGDINSNLSATTGAIKGSDGLRLIQAYRTGNAAAKPIVASNRRFAENQTGSGSATKQVLYRLSKGHGGVMCEGCHGSTHAEWPNAIANANDNVAATQLQGHTGKIVECIACHGTGTLTTADFRGNFDSSGWMKGPHGMHPVDSSWISGHRSVFNDSGTPAGTCQACHGGQLQGSVLSRMAANRTFNVDDRGTKSITQGTQIGCTLCHENPLNHN
jgi:hypothetical protein